MKREKKQRKQERKRQLCRLICHNKQIDKISFDVRPWHAIPIPITIRIPIRITFPIQRILLCFDIPSLS